MSSAITLAEYITALIEGLRQCDAEAYRRMVHVVGERQASIQLDTQSVHIHMRDGILHVESSAHETDTVNGEGATDSDTVLSILRGDIEVCEAILNGSLEVYGDIDQINRMFLAVEILLDASPRCPVLQKLSERFVADAARTPASQMVPRVNWYPFAVDTDELVLLSRYGLLPS